MASSIEQGKAAERSSAAIKTLLDGTGFAVAGFAGFDQDRTSIEVSLQGKADVLQGTTVLDVADVACAHTILHGIPVNITENADEQVENDALLRELRVKSFFAEPLGATDDSIDGFLFVGHHEPVQHCGLALRTFLSNLATWLLSQKTGRAVGEHVSLNGDLATQNELLAEALVSIDRGVIVFDADYKITTVNALTYELLDATPDVVKIGATVDDLIQFFAERGDYGSEESAEQKSKMRALIDLKKPHSYDRHLPDGRIVACKGQPYKSGMIVTYTDVSDFRARERERLENEKLLSETLLHMEQGLIVFDKNLDILAVNPQVSNILGIPVETVQVGGNMRTFVELCAKRGDFGPGDPEDIIAAWMERVGRNEPYSVERQTPNGTPVVASVRPRAHGGHILTFTDVTEWRNDQRELGAKTELLSTAMDNMGQGLIVYDSNMVIEAYSERAKTLLNVPDHVLAVGASMVTLTENWIAHSAGETEDVKAQLRDAQQKLTGNEPFSFERDMPSGSTILCSGRARDNGGYVVTLTDVTESRQQERLLSEQNTQFEAILEHMAQGLFAFDKDMTLLFANERAKMMIGCPREMLEPGKSFEDVVRYCAELGAYEMVKAQQDATFEDMVEKGKGSEPFSFERQCAGGIVALVRSHPRPQGGHIVTYTDITEAKRQQTALAEATEALCQNSEQLDKVFTNMSSGIAMFDADCNMVICNPQYQELFDLPDALVQQGVSLVDINAYCVASGDVGYGDADEVQRLEVAKSRETKEFRVHKTDGRIINVIHEPLDDGGSIAVYEDVTAREAAEQKLRDYAADLEHQRSVLQTVMENMDQGISLMDGDLRLQAFNRRFLELLEFPTDLIRMGQSLDAVFRYNAERGEYGPGDPEQQVRERMDLAARFEAHCFVRERPDGTVIEVEGKPLANKSGFVTTYTDVTEVQRHEREIKALAERLTESNLRLDAAFNNMNQGLAMFDAEHRLVVRNKRYLEIFNIPEDAAVEGTPLEEIAKFCANHNYAGSGEEAVAMRMTVADSREQTSYQQHMSDGRIVEINHEPLENGGSLALYQDVTDRENADRSLREHAAKLEASNRELQEFAYVAAHDLQEPLRKIEAFGDRLHKKCGDRLGEEGLRYVTRMQASSRRLRTLIDALLGYSRVTTKAAPFKTVDLQKLAGDVISDLETSIEQADAEIELCPLPTIDCDEVQMRQLFMNLIANSLKFRKEGRPLKVRIDATEISPQGDRSDPHRICVLTFKDNGIGFDSKYADRIFTIFQRLHSRAEYDGTGIGLATCRKIVERHQGCIEGSGSPDEGATFEIRLPARQDSAVRRDAVKSG